MRKYLVKVLIILLFLPAFSSCIMSLRTLKYKEPDVLPGAEYVVRKLDVPELAKKLSKALQIPTRSMIGEWKSIDQPFLDYHRYLEENFPTIHQIAEKTIINNYSLVYKFKGKNAALMPGAYAAHIDVVPAPSPERWSFEPFSGTIHDGYIYGRGAQDMKSTMIAMMEGMETLLNEGYQPERDIYFCFGHDEEPPTTEGALKIAEWFKKQQIRLEFLVDEGGTILDGNIAKIKHVFALIGICEKGYVDMKVTVKKEGGHGSLPVRPTAVTLLSKAVQKIERNPMKSRITPALKLTMQEAAPYLPYKYKILAANHDILLPITKSILKKVPLTNTLISTTFMPTMLNASDTENIIPHEATASINVRILPGSTREDVKSYMQKLVGKSAQISYTMGTDPTPISDINSASYSKLTESIVAVFPNTVSIPYMFIANTDSRYYYDIADNIYLFTPFTLTPDDQKRIHGVDERCSIQNLEKATHFFIKSFETMGK